jgi:hypothetical protein
MSYSAERHSVIRVRAAYRDSRHEAGLSIPSRTPLPPPRRPSTTQAGSGYAEGEGGRGQGGRGLGAIPVHEGLWMWGNCAPALCPRPAPCSDAHGVDL